MTWIIMPPKTFDGEILLSSSKISKYGSPTSKFFPLSQYFYELPSAPPSANLHTSMRFCKVLRLGARRMARPEIGASC